MCMCVCVCVHKSIMNLVLPGASSLLVEQREQRLMFSKAPPPFQSSLLCRHSPPPRRPRCYAVSPWPRPSGGPPACACLSCAGTGSREEEKKGRKREGREGRREGGYTIVSMDIQPPTQY